MVHNHLTQVIKAGGHHLDFINKYQAGEQLSFQVTFEFAQPDSYFFHLTHQEV